MASFPNMVLTNAGKNMIVQAQLGQELIFTQGKYGNGTVESGQDQTTFVDLINPLLNLPIQSMTNPTAGQAMITVKIDRTNLETGFFGRELGLFAKIGSSGTEQLFCYTNAGAQSDFIPDKNDSTIPYDEFIDIATVIGNATSVSILVDQTKVYVTHSDFHAHIQLNHLWLFRQAVKVGDICYSSSVETDSYKMMECIQAGTTGTIEPTWGAVESTVTDGTARWQVCDLRDSSVAQTKGRKVVLGDNGAVPIPQGGTGATNVVGAIANLGVTPTPTTAQSVIFSPETQPVAPSGGTWIWWVGVAYNSSGVISADNSKYGIGVVSGSSSVGIVDTGYYRNFIFWRIN